MKPKNINDCAEMASNPKYKRKITSIKYGFNINNKSRPKIKIKTQLKN